MQIIRDSKYLVATISIFCVLISSSVFAQMLVDKLGAKFPLFSGQDISFWSQTGNANWSTFSPNGVAAEQGSGTLTGRLPVTDFQIQFSYWLDKDTRFSIYAHCVDINYIASDTALEINLSSAPIKKYANGSVVGLIHAQASPARLNQWNDVMISSISNQLTVTINGVSTVNKVDYNRFLSGPFAMRYSGGKLKLINVYATIPGRW